MIALVALLAPAIQKQWITGNAEFSPADKAGIPVQSAASRLLSPTFVSKPDDLEPKTLGELLDLPSDQLHRVDIARMNLLCASRLPSTSGLNIDHALATLDGWAKQVAFETDRHLYRVTDPQYAERYGGSEPHFRAEMLAQVLQEDLSVKYDMTSVGNFSFADPTVAFIHGMIPTKGQTTADTPGGTCASMPVLYVAVGRRLGYPLKLATTDSHIFARWDGEGNAVPAWRETFNCEATNGFHRFDDAYYRTWPNPVSDRQVAINGFLESLTPAEEMAQFMAARGHHGLDVGEVSFAARCYENAFRYDPWRPCYQSWFMDAANRSGYQASTPALQRMATSTRPRFSTQGRRQADILGMPRPSQTRMEILPGMPRQQGLAARPHQLTAPGAHYRNFQTPGPTTQYNQQQTPR